jgi:hypothetical protein
MRLTNKLTLLVPNNTFHPSPIFVSQTLPEWTTLGFPHYPGKRITLTTNIRLSWNGFIRAGISLSREPLLKGRLSTVGLLALTSLDERMFIFKILLTFFLQKQVTLMRRSTVLSLPL